MSNNINKSVNQQQVEETESETVFKVSIQSSVPVEKIGDNSYPYCDTSTNSDSNSACLLPTEAAVIYLNWADEKSYPKEKIDVIVGSDLVYDNNILAILVPAVNKLLSPGKSFRC